MFQGTIPVLDAEYDLSDPAGTASTAVSGVIGVTMMLGIFALGRSLYNTASKQTDSLNEVELL